MYKKVSILTRFKLSLVYRAFDVSKFKECTEVVVIEVYKLRVYTIEISITY